MALWKHVESAAKKKIGLEVPPGVNNYGMVLQDLVGEKWVTRNPS